MVTRSLKHWHLDKIFNVLQKWNDGSDDEDGNDNSNASSEDSNEDDDFLESLEFFSTELKNYLNIQPEQISMPPLLLLLSLSESSLELNLLDYLTAALRLATIKGPGEAFEIEPHTSVTVFKDDDLQRAWDTYKHSRFFWERMLQSLVSLHWGRPVSPLKKVLENIKQMVEIPDKFDHSPFVPIGISFAL